MKPYLRSVLVLMLLSALTLTIAAQEQPQPQSVNTTVSQQIQVDYDGVHFDFDSVLASGVLVRELPSTTQENSMIPAPAFTEFTFDSYFPGEYLNYAPMPRIDVFPIESFGDYPFFIAELDELAEILAVRPDLNQYVTASPGSPDVPQLPFLPLFNAAQVFRAQPEYIDVPGIEGIRYLVYFSQAMNPIAEGEVFYTFQGITADGQHYVSAVLPINTGVIPAEGPSIDDPDTFAAEYQGYLESVLGIIAAADGETFSPPLRVLDQMMQSVTVSQ